MKVLYIDGVGPFGGASRSLYEVVRALPPGQVEPHFLAVTGTVLPFYNEVATDLIAVRGLTRFDNTRYSHYRGVRWLVLLRELFHVPFMLYALLAAKRRWGRFDLIHVNEVTEIIPGLLARRLFGTPMVVHVRSLARVDERSWRCRWQNERLRRDASAVIAIDENVRSTLPSDVPVDVIHNSFTPKRAKESDPALIARLDGLRPGSLKIGFIGNLHHSKGVYDLLEAARLVKLAGREVEFVIIGGATRADAGLKAWLLKRAGLAQDVSEGFEARVAEAGVSDNFHLLGATTDIQCVYDRIDVLCFPSHFDAPGRPIFEAAFSAVPSIAAIRHPRPDTLVHGETGLATPGRDPAALASAILHFADDRNEVRRMGENARELARRNFTPSTNARALLDVYQRVVTSNVVNRRPAHQE